MTSLYRLFNGDVNTIILVMELSVELSVELVKLRGYKQNY